MSRKLAIGALVAALIGFTSQMLASGPAAAQASCMHCRFEAAQCKRLGKLTSAKCEEQRVNCVKECKALSSGSSDATKATDKAQNKNKK